MDILLLYERRSTPRQRGEVVVKGSGIRCVWDCVKLPRQPAAATPSLGKKGTPGGGIPPPLRGPPPPWEGNYGGIFPFFMTTSRFCKAKSSGVPHRATSPSETRGGTVVDGGVIVKCSNIWCGCDYTELPRLVRFAHNPPLLFRGGGKRRGMARCRHTAVGRYPVLRNAKLA